MKVTVQKAVSGTLLQKGMGTLTFAEMMMSLAVVTVFCDETYGATEEGFTEAELKAKMQELLEKDPTVSRKLMATAILLDKVMENPAEFVREGRKFEEAMKASTPATGN